jgi:hypothetical protein
MWLEYFCEESLDFSLGCENREYRLFTFDVVFAGSFSVFPNALDLAVSFERIKQRIDGS